MGGGIYFGGFWSKELQMWNFVTEEENFILSHGTWICTKNEESIQPDAEAIAAAVWLQLPSSWFRKLPNIFLQIMDKFVLLNRYLKHLQKFSFSLTLIIKTKHHA